MRCIEPERSLAQIVLDHPSVAPVLERHRLDYCCRGALSLGAACAARGEDERALVAELGDAIANRDDARPDDPREMPTNRLIEHLVVAYHEPLRRQLAEIEHALASRSLPWADTFRELRAEIEPHLDAEETALFPALLERTADDVEVRREVRSMRREHLRIGELLHALYTLTNGFTARSPGCHRCEPSMRQLSDLHSTAMRHVHLENHVLAPRFASGACAVGFRADRTS